MPFRLYGDGAEVLGPLLIAPDSLRARVVPIFDNHISFTENLRQSQFRDDQLDLPLFTLQ